MAFTIEDFEDLIKLLRERPEWRQRLLEVLLTEEFLKLPVQFQAFREEVLERFDRMESQLGAVESRLDAVEARLDRVESRLEVVETQVRAVETRLGAVESRLDAVENRLDRVESRLEAVETQVRAVETRLGRLENVIGLDAENAAADALGYVLELKGFKLAGEPGFVHTDGEVDLVWEVESPAGERLWVVAEAKYRLRTEDVYRFAQRLRDPGFKERLRAAGIPGPYLPYIFGVVKEFRAERRAAELGLGLITARGEAVAPAAPES
jgi:chaperonin cofactor prefoldin